MICCIAVSLLCRYYGMTEITSYSVPTIDDKNGNRYSKQLHQKTRRQRLLLPSNTHLFDVLS